jgi:mannitol/fructose-specific phosphotransferase system IIA component
MPVSIDASHIRLGREEAVRIIGEFMIASGEVTPHCLDGRLEKEARHGTWITGGVALPVWSRYPNALENAGFP